MELKRGEIFAERYEVLECLGAGGMGIVYLVKDLQDTREKALKLTQGEQSYFLREIDIHKIFRHPCIVRLYESGEKNDIVYYTMEYVDGQNLTEWKKTHFDNEKEQKLPELLLYIVDILKALEVTHYHGAVHGDIKPDNIVIPQNKIEPAKLLDFGIAVQKQETQQLSIPCAGMTAEFAAPEVIRTKKVYVQSDVFSLGGVMYFVVTGQLDFEELDGWNNASYIHAELKQIIRTALSSKMKKRYKSTEEMLIAIENFVEKEYPYYKKYGRMALVLKEKERENTDLQKKIEYWREKEKQLKSLLPKNIPSEQTTEAKSEIIDVKSALSHDNSLTSVQKKTMLMLYSQYTQKQIEITPKQKTNAAKSNEILVPKEFKFIEEKEYKCKGLRNKVKIYEEPKVGIRFVLIPGGKFMMGSNRYGNEKPIHEVTIKPFLLGQYPVTQQQWLKVMEQNPSRFKGEKKPVETITWGDCQSFLKKYKDKYGIELNFASEAQWEYACRAGSTGKYYWGEEIEEEYCWYDRNSGNETKEVGSKKPNAFGLYDMSGNVWEWCGDIWHDNYDNAPIDGSTWLDKGNNKFYICRGGSVYSNAENCSSSFRNGYEASFRGNGLGFRISRSFST